jgi:hypothetical protein
MSYTSNRLDAFWSRYVTMRPETVIALTTPGGTAYEPDFAGILNHVYLNKPYGFADYGGPCASPNNGNNKYIGRYGGG